MVSFGGRAPHVLRAHMGRTCGGPNEIELTPIGVILNGWRGVRLARYSADVFEERRSITSASPSPVWMNDCTMQGSGRQVTVRPEMSR